MTNAKVVHNSFGEMKIDKRDSRFKRIDPVDALIDAHLMMMKSKTTEVFDAVDALDGYLESMGWG